MGSIWKKGVLCFKRTVDVPCCKDSNTKANCCSQTIDIVNAILEGYPKSKKQLFVSIQLYELYVYSEFNGQEEVGIETDEDYGVSVPS
jgi:hypothetical protein